MPPRSADVVVTLDGVVRSPSAPLVDATDPMLVRGAGVFETVLLRAGTPCLLDAHLGRLAVSAALVGLPAPDLRRWRDTIGVALAHRPGDGVLRLVHGPRVSFVTVSDVPERALRARRDGVAALTLDPGSRGRISGAKSLSYAVNSAALRYAQAHGADDVVYVDAAGTVLEGPRSSVVIAVGETLLSPPPALPILAGTTVAALFDIAPRCAYRSLTVADLVAAQGVWLLSAVTLAARVHTLDGVALAPAPGADGLARLVESAITG
ncbi:aminodeoxychorismate lyase [Arthrobacter sp. SLBN-53]|uniref:aminodeoxychorismate lyase n=1 Tax=Arthrobacter sp. SLBN-53 TaxID=2768412 RepID=UPI00115174DC|nr:aminodeoxychorismate lyase [Arthrobacter sp. SLBN-53]TQK28935.1 4-amino-4-deoxychorismate lyase [Arthrobacter sp. SLBN-53]